MVQIEKNEEKTLFRCEVCSLLYQEELTANKCETFCKSHNACSLEITKEAINK